MDFKNYNTDKKLFYFNEVTSLTGVKPYVLRFWESEFDEINPETSEDGVKFYHEKDIEFVLRVKKLLFDERLSIPQAKNRLIEIEANNNLEKDIEFVVEVEDEQFKNLKLEGHLSHLLNKIDTTIKNHHW